MDLSNFDPTVFIDSSITDANTKRPLLPAGREFIGTIGDGLKARVWKSNKPEAKIKAGLSYDIPIIFEVASLPPDVQKLYMDDSGKLTIEKITITDSVMIDLVVDADGNPTEGPGGVPIIDNSPGRNLRQKRYRDALDMNRPGENFSWRMTSGRQIRCKIEHEPYNGETYDKIGAVAKV
jgi:hypothetical protein